MAGKPTNLVHRKRRRVLLTKEQQAARARSLRAFVASGDEDLFVGWTRVQPRITKFREHGGADGLCSVSRIGAYLDAIIRRSAS